MTKIYDVTVPLSPEVPTYPGDPPFEIRPTQRVADGGAFNATRISLGTHLGTHVDAPAHFLAGGATVDELPLEILMGKARVVGVSARDRIDRAALEALDLRDDIRVLMKTRMSGQMNRSPVPGRGEVGAPLRGGGGGGRLPPPPGGGATPAVPLGAPYRMVAFPLPNSITAGLRKISTPPQKKPQTQNRHIRMGWNLGNRE